MTEGRRVVVTAVEGTATQLAEGTRVGEDAECPRCGAAVVMIVVGGIAQAYDAEERWPALPHRCEDRDG